MRSRVYAFGLASTLFLAPAVASAGPSAPAPANATTMSPTYPTCPPGKVVSKEDSDAAHDRYKAGKLEYDELNYSKAIERFLSAYQFDCTKHELLVIISRAFELWGNKAEALRALEVYLERATPSAAEAATIRARITNMRKQLAEQPPPATKQETPPPPPSTTPPPPPPPPDNTTPAAENREHTVYPWLVAGAGALAIGVGAVVFIVGAQTLPANCDIDTTTCKSKVPGPGEDPTLEDDKKKAGTAKGLQTGGIVTMIGGGALIAGGLLWHFLEPTGPKESAKSKVRPLVGPGFAGVSVGGQF